MPEHIPMDLLNLFIFTMPGFFLVRGFSRSKRSDFEYLMYSLFWGISFMVASYKFFPEKVSSLFGSPHAFGVIFSIPAFLIGLLARKIVSFFTPR